MASSIVFEEYLRALLAGDRKACRGVIQQQLAQIGHAAPLYYDLLWPAMERVEKLFRADKINTATEHMATRMNRAVADQLQAHLRSAESNGKKLVTACADGEPEELGAQMCTDLFEARGWEVYFLGGGVPNDEILSLVGQLRPDILLIYGTQPGAFRGYAD